MPVYALIFGEVRDMRLRYKKMINRCGRIKQVLGLLSEDIETAHQSIVYYCVCFVSAGVVVGVAMFLQVRILKRKISQIGKWDKRVFSDLHVHGGGRGSDAAPEEDGLRGHVEPGDGLVRRPQELDWRPLHADITRRRGCSRGENEGQESKYGIEYTLPFLRPRSRMVCYFSGLLHFDL